MSQNEELLSKLPACPVETTLTLIGNKWEVLILRDLMEGTKRFGELRRSVGHISQKVLTSQLRAMEEAGLSTIEVFAEVPPARGVLAYAAGQEPEAHGRTRAAGTGRSTSATCQTARRW